MQGRTSFIRQNFMVIQGTLTNGTFSWISPHKYRNTTLFPGVSDSTKVKNNYSFPCPSIGNVRMPVYARCCPRSNACYPCKSWVSWSVPSCWFEGLVVDTLEGTFDYCIFLLLCLKNTLVQIDVLVVGKWRIKRENFFGPFSAKVALQTPSTTNRASKVAPQTPTSIAHHDSLW